MIAPYLLSSSTVVPVSPEVAFDGMLAVQLEDLFPHRAGLIPAVRECTGQVGDWNAVGQTRTVVLADGNTNLETLITADRPGGVYEYRLTSFTGPMKALARTVDGHFSFVAEGNGSRVTWSWAIQPTNAVTRLAMPAFGTFWKQYAARMWPLYAARL